MMLRYHPPGVVPLEVWDVLIDGVPLYLVPVRERAQAIDALVMHLKAGTAQRQRGQRLPLLLIDRVVMGGGGANHDWVAQVSGAAWGGSWDLAKEGGLQLGASLGADRTLVVDLGQTAIKWFYGDRQGRVPRPMSVPLEMHARHDPSARARTIAFVVDALGQALQADQRPDVVVLGMPCEIDDHLVVAGCSYPWPDGDRSVVAEVVAGAGLQASHVWVLNDAELAAVSVQVAGAGAGTLVLTIGLGVGAAYLAGGLSPSLQRHRAPGMTPP
jgi:hypothetical protein